MRHGTTMPAGQLHVLLWYYFSPATYPSPSGCHTQFCKKLVQLGLIKPDEGVLTEKGTVYIEQLLKVPLPVMAWIFPTAS